MEEKVLEIRNYEIKYENGNTIQYKDFDIYKGEFLGIIGVSGCGKTSLLNSLLMYEFPGSIKYDKCTLSGRDLKTWGNDKFSCISYMPQFSQDSLNPMITIEKHIELTLKGNKLNYDKTKIEDVFKCLDLNKEIIKKYPSQLSGGMKQRVALMLAYIKQPKILIMDEPSSALDYITLKSIISFLKSMKGELTIVMVSHNKEFLKTVCSRVISI